MIKPHNANSEFELGGINHVALVCSDMARTVDFYSNILGMPLIKSLDLPGGAGQHFFFDAGNGDCVAFFWFADAPDRVPRLSSPAAIPGIGEITSAVSTMNHLAFHVPADKFDDYRQRLKAKGVRVGPVLNHDESATQVAAAVHPGVYVRSFYFQDPDGIRFPDHRIWIEHVLYQYIYNSRTAEVIQKEDFPSLSLEQVYAAILYYLHNKEAMTQYVVDWLERGRTIGERRQRLLRGLAILVAGVAIVAGAAGT